MEDYYGIKSRRAREYIRSLPFKKKIPWKAMFPKTNDLALDLLERLLAFNPVKRITVEEALKHPYLEPYHDPDDEPTADPIPEEFFDFDKNKDNLTKEQLKRTSSSCSFVESLLTFKSPHLPGDYAVNFHVSPSKCEIYTRYHHRVDFWNLSTASWSELTTIFEEGLQSSCNLDSQRKK